MFEPLKSCFLKTSEPVWLCKHYFNNQLVFKNYSKWNVNSYDLWSHTLTAVKIWCRFASLFHFFSACCNLHLALQHIGAVSSAPSAPRHPVDTWTIHLKLPNEKPNEASLTERGRAGWPVANRLKCNLHSCGWISDVGVLYKGIWLPAELHDIQLAPWRGSRHTHMYSHTYALILKETESGAGQRVIHMLIIRTSESISPWQTQKQTLYAPNTPRRSLTPSSLCDSLRCQSVSVPLPCPLAQQLW